MYGIKIARVSKLEPSFAHLFLNTFLKFHSTNTLFNRCEFCSIDGCNHGATPLDGKCHLFTCERCKESKCPLEWDRNEITHWFCPVECTRPGGGKYWKDEPRRCKLDPFFYSWFIY